MRAGNDTVSIQCGTERYALYRVYGVGFVSTGTQAFRRIRFVNVLRASTTIMAHGDGWGRASWCGREGAPL